LYAFTFAGEAKLTNSSLNDMIQKNLIPQRKGRNVFQSTIYGIMCLKPTFKAGFLVEEVQKVYERLNQAQARYALLLLIVATRKTKLTHFSGDEIVVRSLATGEALSLAHKIAKTKKNLQWELVKMNEEPKLISARLTPLDAEGKIELAQVVVRFDSIQVSRINQDTEYS
jgi:hypothetical protein